MTEQPLSPTAAAVLSAANSASAYIPDDCLNESRWIAAAALRAVADLWCELADAMFYSSPEVDAYIKRIDDELKQRDEINN